MTETTSTSTSTGVVPKFHARLLPADEWQRLTAIGPFVEAQVLPDPQHAVVLVVEDRAGKIHGCWVLTSIALLEGLWLSEDARKQIGPAKELLLGMLRHLMEYQIKTAITVIQDPAVEAMAQRVGFVAIPGGGTIYTLQVPALQE